MLWAKLLEYKRKNLTMAMQYFGNKHSAVHSTFVYENCFCPYSITEIIALRMRSPWLWPQLMFKLSASGREHDQLIKIIHTFTRQVSMKH